ncbi:MAG: rRNA pseudouridine synthase [Spirochaetes bacterium]|nr:MAG: rRNA pseudouridine synthase [Spirochaetota bacterium]
MENNQIRINKYLAACGLGSRRKVENLVLEGKVRVNDTVITDLSHRVDPDVDKVTINRTRVTMIGTFYYLVLNKPKGYLTTAEDVEGRAIVFNLIPDRFRHAGVFPVGRLDKDTEGLLLLTNDGDVAYTLTHPKFGVEKEYIVNLDRPLDSRDRERLEKGIFLYGKRTNRASISPVGPVGDAVRITINEGKKRQIRIMFTSFGYKVKKLARVRFGPISLGRLHSGEYRLLKPGEIRLLRQLLAPRPKTDFS